MTFTIGLLEKRKSRIFLVVQAEFVSLQTLFCWFAENTDSTVHLWKYWIYHDHNICILLFLQSWWWYHHHVGYSSSQQHNLLRSNQTSWKVVINNNCVFFHGMVEKNVQAQLALPNGISRFRFFAKSLDLFIMCTSIPPGPAATTAIFQSLSSGNSVLEEHFASGCIFLSSNYR